MQNPLFPLGWHWLADDGRVFSAPKGATVDKSDPGFVAFIAAGNVPTRWPADETGAQTDAALDDVLRPYGLGTKGAVRFATTYQLMSVFTDAQRAAYPGPIKVWDQRLFSARDTPWPEDNVKIGRIAAALGTTPAAWFDAALTPAAT